MTTLNKIAFQVAEAAGRADDQTFIERCRDGVGYYRALLIRQDQERSGKVPQQLVQTIAVNLVNAAPADVCVDGLECTVRRSATKVPRSVRVKGSRSPYKYVGTVTGGEPFLYEEWNALKLVLANKFTKHMPRYVYADDYIYVVNVPYDRIAIRDIFDDPSELATFKSCSGTNCFTPDDPYPVSMDMVPRIISAMLGGEFGTGGKSEEQKHEIQTTNGHRQEQ